MKFITMWKDYYNEVLIPSWSWVKRYWIQYGVVCLLFGIGVGAYYWYWLCRSYHF